MANPCDQSELNEQAKDLSGPDWTRPFTYFHKRAATCPAQSPPAEAGSRRSHCLVGIQTPRRASQSSVHNPTVSSIETTRSAVTTLAMAGL